MEPEKDELQENQPAPQGDVEHTPPEKRSRVSGIIVIVLFLAFSVAVGVFIGRPMLQYMAEPERFRLWVSDHGFLGRLVFVGMVVLQIIIALIPGEPLEIGAGYAFGFWEGTLLCMIGIVLGSTLVFLMTKRWGTKLVRVFFSWEKIQSLKFMQDSKRLNTLTFILFFIPGTPKDLLTYAAGLTPIKFSTYALISNLARIPSVVTSTIGGNALGEKEYIFAILTFVIVGAISLIGLMIYRQITKRRERRKEAELSAQMRGSETDNVPLD